MKLFAALMLLVGVLSAQPKPGTGVIEGHVWNSLTGAPLKKATVELTASEINLVADTEADGHFQFTGLPAGTYRLTGKRPGYFERPARRPATIAQDGHVSDAEIRLPPEGAISGRVLDEDGDAVGNGRLQLFKQVYRNGRKRVVDVNVVAKTNENGEYRFPGLKPGHYLVQARNMSPGANSHYGEAIPTDKPTMVEAPAYYPNAADEASASAVEVGVGADVHGIDIHIAKIAIVRGAEYHVRGKVSGVSDPRIVIHLFFDQLDGHNVAYGYAAGPDFTFDTSIRAGQYSILAHVFSGGSDMYATGAVSVTGDVSGVVVAMNQPPEVPARVTATGDGPTVKLRGIRVDVYKPRAEHLVFQKPTDAAGIFEFPKPVEPGHYSIEVATNTLPEGCYVQSVKLGGQEISPDDFEIPASAPLEIILSRDAGKITGSAVDEDGKPLLNATVTLFPSSGTSHPVKQAVADDGSFQFTALRPGKYVLLAWEDIDDDLWQDPEYRKKYEPRATEITVGAGETQSAQVRVIAAGEIK